MNIDFEMGSVIAACLIGSQLLIATIKYGWKYLQVKAKGEVSLHSIKKQMEEMHLIMDKRNTENKLQFIKLNESIDKQNILANRCSRRIGGVDKSIKSIDKRLYKVEEYLGNGFHKAHEENKDGKRS
jgi:hypothetical protein